MALVDCSNGTSVANAAARRTCALEGPGIACDRPAEGIDPLLGAAAQYAYWSKIVWRRSISGIHGQGQPRVALRAGVIALMRPDIGQGDPIQYSS
jgi:hypothetical protein